MKINLHFLAKLISTIFSPPFFVIFFLIAAFEKGFFAHKLTVLLFIFFIFISLLLFYFFLLKTKRVSDSDITKREERYPILLAINISIIFLLVFLKFAQAVILFKYVLIVYIVLTISSLITLYYKISLHMTFALTFLVLINYTYSFKLFYLFLAIPAVFWSRLYLKKHTIFQLFSAIIIDSLIIYLLL